MQNIGQRGLGCIGQRKEDEDGIAGNREGGTATDGVTEMAAAERCDPELCQWGP